MNRKVLCLALAAIVVSAGHSQQPSTPAPAAPAPATTAPPQTPAAQPAQQGAATNGDQAPPVIGVQVNEVPLIFTVTDGRGRAAVHSIEFNRVPGRFQIRIVASKEQARAGTVSFQYIAGPSPGATAATVEGGGHHRKKWLIVAAAVVAGAGAAGGAMALVRPSPAAGSTTILSIGPPSVTVSKP